jgi:endonuclease/exonuclease/phosphatase family metal-dependent hydrolase
MGPRVRIATYNIFLNLHFWEQRLPLIVEELNKINADIICLQEVVLPRNTAQEIADRLKNKYHVTVVSENDDITQRSDLGLAILSKNQPIEVSKLYLGSKEKRTALRVTFKKGLQRFDVIDTHLYWKPYNLFHKRIRLNQVKRILSWAKSNREVVICGDMNATPKTRVMRYFYKKGFRSGHKLALGHEPDWTCANPVGGPERTLRDRIVLHLYNLARKGKLGIWRDVLDYVLVTQKFKVLDAGIFGQNPSKQSKRIFPSDHRGVYVDIRLPMWSSNRD